MLEESITTNSDFSVRDYLDIVRRRKLTILQTFAVAVAIGVIFTLLAKPVYRSDSRILVEGKEEVQAEFNTGDPLSGLFMPPVGHDVDTQIEVLQGQQVVTGAFEAAGVPGDEVNLEVKQIGATDVIGISAESANPAYAERVCKQLPDTYLSYIRSTRKKEILDALTFARNQLKDERDKLEQVELEEERFKDNAKIASVTSERDQIIHKWFSALDTLQGNEEQVIGLQAQLAALRATRAKQSLTLDTPTTTTNAQIELIKNQMAALNTERAQLLIEYKPNNVEVMKIDAQIGDLQQRLAAVPPETTIVTRVPNPTARLYDEKIPETEGLLEVAKARLAHSRARAAEAKDGLQKNGLLEVRQAELARAIAEDQENVAELSKNVQELSLRQEGLHSPIQVITPAGTAHQIAPKKATNVAYSCVVGLLLGFCFALVREFLDDRVNSPDDALRLLGAPGLGYLPLIDAAESHLLSKMRGSSSLLESYRVLRSSVRFATVDTPVRSLLITSTMPNEGKSVTAANLAIAMALDGRRVILVDADLRRPTLHDKFGTEQSPGLTNVLVGQMSAEEGLRETSFGSLQLLTAGPLPPNAAELLNSRAMRQLHSALRERADIVIFDSPPCLATADAQVLSADVDGVLYVVEPGVPKKSAVQHAAEILRQAHANVLGIVFNKVITSERRESFYGFYGDDASPRSFLRGRKSRRREGHTEFEAVVSGNRSREADTVAVVRSLDENGKEK